MASVAILLSTFNGEQFIKEQVSSIFSQVDVKIDLFLVDDGSSDKTLDVIKEFNDKINFINRSESSGSAGLSYLRLIYEVDFSKYDFVSLSDQDDVWLPGKLKRAIELITQFDAQGYSANDIAFWPDGKLVVSNKNLPQKKYDHYFESIGRGCSFVMRSEALQKFKDELFSEGFPNLNHIMHDWLIYSYFRERGMKWITDSNFTLLYRQHEENSLGANVGINSIVVRFNLMKGGWYGEVIRNIFMLVKPKNNISEVLSRKWILKNIFDLRRSKKDRILLAIYVLFFKI